jgi:hypothetical protein
VNALPNATISKFWFAPLHIPPILPTNLKQRIRDLP